MFYIMYYRAYWAYMSSFLFTVIFIFESGRAKLNYRTPCRFWWDAGSAGLVLIGVGDGQKHQAAFWA